MLIDYQTPQSPGWWLIRLGKKLAADQPRCEALDNWRNGESELPHGNKKMREAYRRLQRIARTNFAGLVIESVLERMKVIAFRVGADSTATDKKAWAWWQANSLDADSGIVHRAAVTMSRAYVSVGDDPDNPGQPLVTGEDPRQTMHESSPLNRRKLLAVLKTYRDDLAGVQRAMVYLPNQVWYFVTTKGISKDATAAELWASQSWELDTSDERYPDGWGANRLGEVPFVPFVNRPDLAGNGTGEFEDVIDVLQRINTTILDRLVIAAMQAYRQRWATGINPVDETGAVKNPYEPGADLLWLSDEATAKFGEFNVTDVGPIIKAVDSDVQHLAAITRTPPHYLLAGLVNVSGTALGAAETGLVSKLGERETEYGESWERVYRLVGKLMGEPVDPGCEVVWRDPQFRTLAEMADAILKLRQAGVPWRAAMEYLGVSPQEVDRWEAMRVQDALLSDSLASLSIAEGGELGTRGVSYKGTPTDTTGAAGSPTGSTATPAVAPSAAANVLPAASRQPATTP